MDPKTGMIDINILTTGLSISDRKRRLDVAKGLKEFLNTKKGVTHNIQKTYEEFKEQSDAVSINPYTIYFFMLASRNILFCVYVHHIECY